MTVMTENTMGLLFPS